MDPQACWEYLLDAYCDHDWGAVEEHAMALLDWLEKAVSRHARLPSVGCVRLPTA